MAFVAPKPSPDAVLDLSEVRKVAPAEIKDNNFRVAFEAAGGVVAEALTLAGGAPARVAFAPTPIAGASMPMDATFHAGPGDHLSGAGGTMNIDVQSGSDLATGLGRLQKELYKGMERAVKAGAAPYFKKRTVESAAALEAVMSDVLSKEGTGGYARTLRIRLRGLNKRVKIATFTKTAAAATGSSFMKCTGVSYARLAEQPTDGSTRYYLKTASGAYAATVRDARGVRAVGPEDISRGTTVSVVVRVSGYIKESGMLVANVNFEATTVLIEGISEESGGAAILTALPAGIKITDEVAAAPTAAAAADDDEGDEKPKKRARTSAFAAESHEDDEEEEEPRLPRGVRVARS